MTRHTATDAAPHVHLRDATNHLANARRSLEAAAANAELRLAVLGAERWVRRLGKAVARAQRTSPPANHDQKPAGRARAGQAHVPGRIRSPRVPPHRGAGQAPKGSTG